MENLPLSRAVVDGVIAIARDAGRAILDIYATMGADVLVARKADDSPLTQADLAAHRVIAAGLARLTPDIPVVSEEDAASQVHRKATGAFWLIDPLDGTKEFLARNGDFTVNIALVRDGAPVFGVVFAPVHGHMYWGGAAMGAFREAAGQVEPLRVVRPVPAVLRVVASKSHLNAETADFIARLGAHEMVQAGSSLKFCRIAEGAADVYPRLGPTCEWDTAAAQAVVEAAGGHVAMLDGTPLRYGRPDVLNPYFVASSLPLGELPGQG